jgi:hypothetical protein
MDANHVPEGYPLSLKVRTSKEQEGFDSVVRDQEELDNILNQGTNETIQRIVETCYPFVKGDSALIDNIFERNESVKRLVEALFPFQKDSLTLIDTTFQRFHGGPNGELARKLALKLVEEQVPKRFSRDPYLQLEKYYAGIGEEDDAVKMHRRGHSALRENAKNNRSRHPDKTGNVKWSWYKIWVIDFALKHLTGYGTRAWLAVLYLLPLLVIGTIVFCGNHTLLTKGDLENVGSVSPGHSFAYSLDLLIPVLTFPLTDSWVPSHSWGLADFRVLWIFVGVGQGYGDEPSPEGSPVDARQTSEEVPAACLGEASYPSPDSSSMIPMRSGPGFHAFILEGESRYRPFYRGRDIGNPLM